MPRAHRPRAPIMSAPAPLTAPLAPLRSPPATTFVPTTTTPVTSAPTPLSGLVAAAAGGPQVSLLAPRPETERSDNVYVETPIRPAHREVPPPPPVAFVAASTAPPRVQRPTRLPIPPPPAAQLLPPVTKQPQSAGAFGKEAAVPSPAIHDTRPSIICGECGRCSCPSCQQPRPLPECWTSTYHCSADTIIDYASCLCCVKGLFYHCSEADGGDACVDEPCNCGPDRRAARWGCLTALSCVLPCLLFYWPLQCGKHVVEACYARHSRLGCRCRPKATTSLVGTAQTINTPEKRLLDATPDF